MIRGSGLSFPKHRKLKGEWLCAYLFIAPLCVGTAVFGLFPVVCSLFLSFTDWELLTGFGGFVGLKNFITVFTKSETLYEIRNTLMYAVFYVPITLLLSLGIANLLNKPVRGKGVFRVIYFLPNIVMPAAVALIWRFLLNTKFGLVNVCLGALHLPTPSWISDPHYIMASLIIVSIWSGIGYNTIILLASIQGIPRDMFEAADLEGASGFTVFWKITFPMVSPSVFFLLTMGIMKAMRAFDIVYMFIGKDNWSAGGPLLAAVRTMVYGIYTNAFERMDMGFASAESVVLFLMIMAMTAIQFKVQKKWVYYD